jgi:hypothetical protein
MVEATRPHGSLAPGTGGRRAARGLQAGALGLLGLLALLALRPGSAPHEHHHVEAGRSHTHAHLHAGPHRHLAATSPTRDDHAHHQGAPGAPEPSGEEDAPTGAYAPSAPALATRALRAPEIAGPPPVPRALAPRPVPSLLPAAHAGAFPPRAPPR